MSIEGKARSALFARGQPGGPVVIDGANEHPGNIWFVDSGQTTTGGNTVGHGRSPDKPFLTLAYAFSGDCPTANNGDVIYVMPGHTESVIAAGTITQDIAGVKVIGLGVGNDRPIFTFSTADTATWVVSGASSWIENVILLSGVNACANNLVISGADCVVKNVTIRDASSTVEFAGSILTTAAADRLVIDGLEYQGFIAGDACTRVIQLVGINDCKILNSSFYGEVSTAIVDITTASHNVEVDNCYFYNDNVALTKNVVDTATGSTWWAKGYDGKGGYGFSGGSGASGIAADDVGTVSTAVSGLTSWATTSSTAVSGLTSSFVVQSTAVSGLTSRATTSSTAVSGLTSSFVVQSTAVSGLTSWATTSSTAVSGLTSRATTSSTAVSGLTSSFLVQSAAVSGLTSSFVVQSTAVSTLTSYLVVIQSYVISGW